MTQITYTSKSTAIRGAKRAGLAEGSFTVYEAAGRWVYSAVIVEKRAEASPELKRKGKMVRAFLKGTNVESKATAEAQAEPEALPEPKAKRSRKLKSVPHPEALAAGGCPHCNASADACTDSEDGKTRDCGSCSTKFNAATGKAVTAKNAGRQMSDVVKPTKLVWHIADAMPGASRKEVIAACMGKGITYNTASTQYHHWKQVQQNAE